MMITSTSVEYSNLPAIESTSPFRTKGMKWSAGIRLYRASKDSRRKVLVSRERRLARKAKQERIARRLEG